MALADVFWASSQYLILISGPQKSETLEKNRKLNGFQLL